MRGILAALLLAASLSAVADEATWVRYLDAGTAAYNRRDPAEATRQFELALKEAEGFGEADPRLTTSLAWLAELYRVQRRFDEAERLIRRTISLDEKYRGMAHTDLAMSLESLALLFHTQNRQREMEPVLKRALSIYEKALGPNHPRVASSLNNLASLYRNLGRIDEAEPLVSRALAIREKALGFDHPDTVQSRNYLAQLHRDLARGRSPARRSEQRSAEVPVVKEAPPVAQAAAPAPVAAPAPAPAPTSVPVVPLVATPVPAPASSTATPATAYAAAPVPQPKAVELPAPGSAPAPAPAPAPRLKPATPAVVAPPARVAVAPKASQPPPVAAPSTPPAPKPAAPAAPAPQAAIKPQPVPPPVPVQPPVPPRPKFRSSLALQMVSLGAAAARNSSTAAAQAFEVMQLAREREEVGGTARITARFGLGDEPLAKIVSAREDLLDRWHSLDKAIVEASSGIPSLPRGFSEVAQLRQELAGIDQRITQQDGLIAQRVPKYRDFINPLPVPLAEAQGLLGADEALLSYLIDEGSSYLIVVRRDRYQFLNLDIGHLELSSIIKRLRSELDHPAGEDAGRSVFRAFPVAQANQLYRRILAPAAPLLQGVSHLIIVADDSLNGLPFATLVTEPYALPIREPEEHAKVSWLGRLYALTMLPSEGALRALRRSGRNTPAGRPFAGFGDPLLGGEDRGGRGGGSSRGYSRNALANVNQVWSFAPLPETRYALYAMADILHADQDSVFLQGEATESSVKRRDLAGYRVLAFATHGFMADDFRGLAESALVFTPPDRATERDDGLLTASEVAQLKLDADLVILTATSTAAADGTPDSEGVTGLSRAFMFAGTRALLATHWAVPSDATLKLVTRTLRERNRGIGNAEALRRAMLPLMNGEDRLAFAHPSYWAPFMVVGEGNRGQMAAPAGTAATPALVNPAPRTAQPAAESGDSARQESAGPGIGRFLQGIFGGGK